MIWNLNRKEHEEELIEGSVCLRHLKKVDGSSLCRLHIAQMAAPLFEAFLDHSPDIQGSELGVDMEN